MVDDPARLTFQLGDHLFVPNFQHHAGAANLASPLPADAGRGGQRRGWSPGELRT
jgi:hypothetical protein